MPIRNRQEKRAKEMGSKGRKSVKKPNSLDSLQKVIAGNISNRKEPCRGCPVAKNHTGPVFIKHGGKSSPKVVIISESPAGFGLIEYDFSKLNEWIKNILKRIKTFPTKEISNMAKVTKLSDFLAWLTDNRMVSNPGKLTTISNIYWTHAVKCFIQRKGESINKAKERLGNEFKLVCNYCREYVKKELEIIKPNLIVAIGDPAFYSMFPKNSPKEIGRSVRFLDAEVVYTYHPNAKIEKKRKEKGFKYAKERITCYL